MTIRAAGLLALLMISAASFCAEPARRPLAWNFLPSLPDREGFAAPFAGVSGGALLVAGGANFPEKKPWENGVKVWHDSVFVLTETNSSWCIAGKLPRPLAYGVSLSTTDGVLCIGGSDALRHYADVFLLQWTNGALRRREMPPLPSPCANLCGALVGNLIYVAGGIASPTSTNALETFWSLDLTEDNPRWRTLESWPGRPRMLSVAGSLNGRFYLFGGVDLRGDAQGKPVRTYLRDSYRYDPSQGWQRVANLPRPATAAPSPAPVHDSQLLIISGDDGTLTNFEPMSRHPGFPRDILAYDPGANLWTNRGESPVSLATAPTVEWRGDTVIANGEVRPGVRTSALSVLKKE